MTRVIQLPKGNAVPIPTYLAAWRALKALPGDREVTGWEWYPVPAGRILDAMMAGVHDRINRHQPGYGRGRHWDPDYDRAMRHAARAVNTPRLRVRVSEVPSCLRARLAHRLTSPAEE